MEEKKQEACRLLDKFFLKMSMWPVPTGLSVYEPRETDIIIATYPKSGTTLLQNMAYQIAVATGGAPPFDPDGTNFTDIEQVVPWVDYGPQCGIMECPSNPRMFKTHSAVQNFDITKSKFVYCIRNPFDWPASWLDFLFDWVADENTSDPEVRNEIFQEFVRRRLLGRSCQDHRNGSLAHVEERDRHLGPWFLHVKYWTAEPRHNVLVLFFEEVVKDLAGTAKRLASFMGRTLSAEGLATVVERCDRNLMASDEKFGCNLFSQMVGLDRRKGGMKAVSDRKTGFKGMRIEEASVQAYMKMMQSAFGIKDYSALCLLIRDRHNTLRDS